MFRLAYKALFASRGTNARLTLKRMGVILALFPSYIIVEAINWLGFLLDDIFFRKYRYVQIKKPLFIVGNPRSGTTLLHRLLARDEINFTSMKLWEILFAPSIIQKKFWMAIGKLDRKFGSSAAKQIVGLEEQWFHRLGKMHKVSLFEPEEDELVLLHIFSSAFLLMVFPFEDDLRAFVRFDNDIPAKDRKRIMTFYKRCVQCHLFVFGNGRRFLSKNPVFSPKVQSINETFQDSRIVCMVRTPFQMLPSLASLLTHYYNSFASPLEVCPMRELLFDTTAHWYHHTVESLEKLPSKRQAIVRYSDMVQNPCQTVADLYERFGLQCASSFRQILMRQDEKTGQYKSRHKYSLEEAGITREEIISRFDYVFKKFGFDTMEDAV